MESGIATVHNDTEYWAAIADQSVYKIILANDITAQESARVGNGNIQRSLTID
ncbi:pectate lyase-like adhesive domain-containing protein, partial [Bacillus cereus]|uniref:pectate lyase-like adhesive domain-containing protein n=1 Tax=Bacillus cereus TaxID=1396 RepID=UPI0034E06ACB